jgi:uncharacterized protein (TIGR02118 family)
MIKLVYCITKKGGMSSAQFFDHWRNVHGPIGARIPGLVRLVQSHVVTNPGDRTTPDFDGMAELWFNSWEDLIRARSSPEWAASSADEANFINSKKVAYFVTAEYEIPLSKA